MVPEAGMYFIKVDLNDNTYIMEKTSWGIIGDAINGSWDDDVDMSWSEEDQALSINVAVSDGEFKFRANDAWDLNYGDTGGDVVLDLGGDNISVAAGDYKILLYLNRPDYTYEIRQSGFDRRPNFYSDGQTLSIDDVTQFSNGYAVTKFKNITSDGSPGSDTDFPDTDFPVFRLADIHLMAAEALLRMNGDKTEAADHFNIVSRRGYGGSGGAVAAANLDLDMILEERARELYWEGHRRTDLVRFGQFSDGTYLWEWKGGVKEGIPTESYRDIFPIPSSDIAANPNLVQNEGY